MPLDNGSASEQAILLVPGLKCAACMTRVEAALNGVQGVISARANLTAHTARVAFDPDVTGAEDLVTALGREGFDARPMDSVHLGVAASDRVDRDLLLRLGVAGFAAMNVMLLSVSVWSGAEASTRDLLHWVSGLIALPTVAYSGQPFFKSAFAALSVRCVNMDVPISLAVILASANSVLETARSAEHAYFDAAVMLIFFLLIGRYLEHRTRAGARSAAVELMSMTGRTAMRVTPDGTKSVIAVGDLERGMIIEITPGERIPADGLISHGRTELDRALITGESLPEPAAPGDAVHAGMLKLTGLIHAEISATGDGTLLAEIARLVDAAERGKGRLDRLADKVARIYVPIVHALAAIASIGWFLANGDALAALQIAVAVLIVTCPCALALAVPTVHTVATARLFSQGIFLKDGVDLERLAEIDTVAFDKTGTLTGPEPELIAAPASNDPAWGVAAALASASRHPLSRAVAREAGLRGLVPSALNGVTEHAGSGVEGNLNGCRVRLGRPGWAGPAARDGMEVILSQPSGTSSFKFAEEVRTGAVETSAALSARGLDLAILSGDGQAAVTQVAAATGIGNASSQMHPGDKLAWLQARRDAGRKVLMVGDGLNDGPALAAAHCSMSPASASDVAKTAAGLVFTADNLGAVAEAHRIACTARRRIFQSFGIAAVYNAIAIPLAMAGQVTPLIAALAMSASSILVVLNALRLRGNR
ncbi:MAG: heavy metal translocating P-type ATPase [Pseudomonadota bacterium]